MDTINQKPGRYARKKQRQLPSFFSPIYFAITFAYIELVFHIKEFSNISAIFPILFAIPLGFITGLICDLFPGKVARVLRYVLSAAVITAQYP